MKVAISGASGLIGTALSQELRRRGHEAVAMVRHKDREGIYWSAEKMEIDEEALKKVDAVVHLAGENLTSRRWTEEQKRKIMESRRKGTELVAGTMAKLREAGEGPDLLVSASAVGYYGGRGEELLDEEKRVGEGFLAEVCEAWEKAADGAREAGVRVIHPRIGIVMAKEGGALDKMLLPFKLGIGGRLGDGEQYFSWVTIDDTVGALVFLLEEAEARDLGGPYNVSAPEPVTNKAFTKALGKELGRPTFLPVPGPALKLVMGGELAEEALLQGQRAVPKRLLEAGYEFEHTTVEQGLKAVLR